MSIKQSKKKADNTGVMLGENAEDVSYKRYKKICYRNLILKSLLFFLLGLVTGYLRRFL